MAQTHMIPFIYALSDLAKQPGLEEMMEPEQLPVDPVVAAAMVVRLVDDIDNSSNEERNALLCALAEAAWGSVLGQNQ
jgi:hypothetical protein